MALADGTPTPLYHAAEDAQPRVRGHRRRTAAAAVAGRLPRGHDPAGRQAAAGEGRVSHRVSRAGRAVPPPQPIRGLVLGYFGSSADAGAAARPSHVVVVNLDYRHEATVSVAGPGPLSAFDATTGKWSAAAASPLELKLPPGGGKLVRAVH